MFPLHVCERIVSHIPIHRRHDLLALLLTDKSFHSATEPILYSHSIFTDVRRIHLFTQTLTKLNSKLALHVRTFGINLHDFFYRSSVQVTQQVFWDNVQLALSLMERLQTLVLIEMTSPRLPYWTQILDHPYPFALEEVKLHLSFDDRLIRFLNAQAQLGGRLRAVRIYNTPPTENQNQEEGGNTDVGLVKSEQLVLPHVETLDISISLPPYIQPKSLPKLTHLQLSFDSPPNNNFSPSQLSNTLSNIITPGSHLHGLSLLHLPHRLSTTTLLQHIAKLTNSTLSHLSHLHLPAPYPSQAFTKSQFLACLIEFPRLSSIELSLDSWDPTYTSSLSNNNSTTTIGPGIPPTSASSDSTTPPSSSSASPQFHLPTPVSQKALISELKTYCPTLRTIVFWFGKVRMRWAFINDGLPFQLTTNSNTGGSGVGGRETNGDNDEDTVDLRDVTTTTTTPSSSSLCRIDNAAWSGEWHYRVETGQWAGHSRLWYTC